MDLIDLAWMYAKVICFGIITLAFGIGFLVAKYFKRK